MKSKKASHQPQSEPPATRLSPRNLQDLDSEMRPVQLAIARRAFEIFEARGCEHGHAWEDWFRAESELLRPVSVSMSESEDRISVRASVPGFEENELRIGIEPRRLTILGKKEMRAAETKGSKLEYIEWHPDQILRFIDLTTEVMPEGAVVQLHAGLLTFDLPKAAKHMVETVAAGA
jgi:HSP20 family protein